MLYFLVQICILTLFLFFHTAVISGAQTGLLLWYQILVPSLLPFILITNALSETQSFLALTNHFPNKRRSQIIAFLAVLLGALCGYPIGSKLLNDFVKSKQLSPEVANHILALSNLASPMFLIGFVYHHALKNEIPLPYFLFSFYFPVFILYLLKRFHIQHSKIQTNSSISSSIPITNTFFHAVEIIVQIGIYVLIFTILSEIIYSIFPNPFFQLILCPLELTNGLRILISHPLLNSIRLPYICGLTAFGGFCSSCQVFSVIESFPVNKKRYYLDKCVLSISTFFLIYFYIRFTS